MRSFIAANKAKQIDKMIETIHDIAVDLGEQPQWSDLAPDMWKAIDHLSRVGTVLYTRKKERN